MLLVRFLSKSYKYIIYKSYFVLAGPSGYSPTSPTYSPTSPSYDEEEDQTEGRKPAKGKGKGSKKK